MIMPNTLKRMNESIDEPSPGGNDSSNIALQYLSNVEAVTLTNMFRIPLENFDSISEKFTNIAKLIRNVELRLLFFSNIREDGQNGTIKFDSITWNFVTELTIQNGTNLCLKPEINNVSNIAVVGDYSILNFVVNSMNAISLLEKVEENLIECLAKKYSIYTSKGELHKNLKKLIKKYSLKTQYENWEETYGKYSVPLPLYWVDFTYNILKRTKRSMSNEFLVSKNIDDAFLCIQKVFESIQKQLEEQESFYGEDYQLVKRFTTCPVVDYFLGKNALGEIDEKKEFIKNMMEKLRGFIN